MSCLSYSILYTMNRLRANSQHKREYKLLFSAVFRNFTLNLNQFYRRILSIFLSIRFLQLKIYVIIEVKNFSIFLQTFVLISGNKINWTQNIEYSCMENDKKLKRSELFSKELTILKTFLQFKYEYLLRMKWYYTLLMRKCIEMCLCWSW